MLDIFFCSLLVAISRICCSAGAEIQLEAREWKLLELEARVSDLYNRLEKGEDWVRSVDSQSRGLNEKLDDVYGNGCPKGFFQCGDDNPRCVYNVLVCNGDIECPNGADEDPAICENPVPAGSLWRGLNIFDTCLGGVFKRSHMRIDTAEKAHLGWGWTKIDFAYINNEETSFGHIQMVNAMEGHYEPATRMMWQHMCQGAVCPSLGNRYYSGIKFSSGNPNFGICYCWRASQAPDEDPCCMSYLTRIK